MLSRNIVLDGGLAKPQQLGDTMITSEIFPAPNTSNALTISGAMLQNGWVVRAPTGAATDTIDSAANLISQMSAGLGTTGGVPSGTTFRAAWYNDTANVITLAATANTGVTVNKPTVNASSIKEFLVNVVNGTPAAVINGTSTNASAVITGITDAQLSLITPGMVVTNATSGLQGQTVLGINRTNGSITMSGNANTSAPLSLNLSPVVVLQGIGQKLV